MFGVRNGTCAIPTRGEDNEMNRLLRERQLRYCSLYDEGFSRIGCVLCPMNRDVKRHIERWPAIAEVYRRAITDTYKNTSTWKSSEEYWRWWLDRDSKNVDRDTPVLFEDDPDMDV